MITKQTNNNKARQHNTQLQSKNIIRTGYVTHQYPKELEKLIKQQWKQMKPRWFITIQWTPPARDFQVAVQHSKHFRNKLLCSLYDCKLNKLASMNDRCRMIWFHEKAPDVHGRIIYHSHLHMSQLPAPYLSTTDLELLLIQKVNPGFRSLQHLFRAINPSIVIKPWKHSHHSSYNLKDYYRFRHHQDADLTLDFENSDLIFTK